MAVEVLSESEGNLDCHNCDDVLKKERGCESKGIMPFFLSIGMVYRCPLTFVENSTWNFIKAYRFYEKNILPNGNGYMNESNRYVQAMMLLENEFGRQINKPKKKRNKNAPR